MKRLSQQADFWRTGIGRLLANFQNIVTTILVLKEIILVTKRAYGL